MWHSGLYSNMNFPAPASMLGFLATVGALALSMLAFVVACFVRKFRAARLILKVTAVGVIVYSGVLLVFSWTSRDHVLVQGQEKYFCEIDCHLAYSVVGVRTEVTGTAKTCTVTLRTRFDETTISPQRPKDAPLTPNPRTVTLLDGQGNRWLAAASSGVPLTTSLKPGDSYLTELQFRVPAEVTNLRLLLTSTAWPERLLIGDEQSPFHGKTWFAL